MTPINNWITHASSLRINLSRKTPAGHWWIVPHIRRRAHAHTRARHERVNCLNPVFACIYIPDGRKINYRPRHFAGNHANTISVIEHGPGACFRRARNNTDRSACTLSRLHAIYSSIFDRWTRSPLWIRDRKIVSRCWTTGRTGILYLSVAL